MAARNAMSDAPASPTPGTASPAAANGGPAPARVPRSVLIVAIVWVVILIASFVLYERDDGFADFVTFKLDPLPFEAIWFGAVGGFLISAQGIFENSHSWDESYDYWHYARPLLGALMGSLGCLVFIVLTEAATKKAAAPNPTFYDVIALAIGYREESFRRLIASLIDTIILPGKSTKTTEEAKTAAEQAKTAAEEAKTAAKAQGGGR
jgi:hypothetical protein